MREKRRQVAAVKAVTGYRTPKSNELPMSQSSGRVFTTPTQSTFTILAVIIFVFGTAIAPVLGVQSQPNVTSSTVERIVHLARPGERDSRYAYVPFDVRHAASRIT